MGERLHRWVPMVEVISSLVRVIHGLIVIKTLVWITVSSRWHVVVRVWEVTIHWLQETKAQSAPYFSLHIFIPCMNDGDENKEDCQLRDRDLQGFVCPYELILALKASNEALFKGKPR